MIVNYNIDSQEVRAMMQLGRKWKIGKPTDRHEPRKGYIVFYEEMSVTARPEILWRIIDLILKEAGNKNLVWRVTPEIKHKGKYGITSHLYMRYAFYERQT